MVKYMPDEFVPRLNALLKEKGIKKKQLCRMLGASTNTVSEWVNNYRVMNAMMFFKLCKTLNVNPRWLLGETDERKTYEE